MAYLEIKDKLNGTVYKSDVLFRNETIVFSLESDSGEKINVAIHRSRQPGGWYSYYAVVLRYNGDSHKPVVNFSLVRPGKKRKTVLVSGQNWETGRFIPWSAMMRVW